MRLSSPQPAARCWYAARHGCCSISPLIAPFLSGAISLTTSSAAPAPAIRGRIFRRQPCCRSSRRNLSWRRQRSGIDPLVRVPEIGTHDRPRALEIDFLHRHHDDGARRLVVHLERGQQFRIGRHMGAAVDPQRAAGPGIRNNRATRGSRTMLRSESQRLLPRRSGIISVLSS